MPDIQLPPDSFIINRYFAKETSTDETLLVEQWMAVHPDETLKLRVLHAGLANQGGVIPSYDEDARVAAIVDFSLRAARRNRLQADRLTNNGIFHNAWWSKINSYSKAVPRAVLYGASTSLIALFLLIGVLEHRSSLPYTSGPSQSLMTYSTGNGERKKITLSDGSTVVLNVASRLEIPANYDAGNRSLRLSGEAVFSVQSRSDAPFTVEAGGTVTRVLGTQFGVRHYPSDTNIVVAVRDGKVAIQSVVVMASQQATILPNGMTQITAASEARFAFVENILMFDGVPLGHAVAELNRWYDVDIRFADSTLASQELWGKFSGNSPEAIVTLLEMTFRVRVVREGRILTLYPGK